MRLDIRFYPWMEFTYLYRFSIVKRVVEILFTLSFLGSPLEVGPVQVPSALGRFQFFLQVFGIRGLVLMTEADMIVIGGIVRQAPTSS